MLAATTRSRWARKGSGRDNRLARQDLGGHQLAARPAGELDPVADRELALLGERERLGQVAEEGLAVHLDLALAAGDRDHQARLRGLRGFRARRRGVDGLGLQALDQLADRLAAPAAVFLARGQGRELVALPVLHGEPGLRRRRARGDLLGARLLAAQAGGLGLFLLREVLEIALELSIGGAGHGATRRRR